MTKKLLRTSVWLLAAGCAAQQTGPAPAGPPSIVETPPAEAAEPPGQPATVPPVPEAPPAPPAPLTAEQEVKLFQDCWAAFNAKDWAKFAPCYSEGASSEEVDTGMPKHVGREAIVEKGAKAFVAQAPDVTGEHQLLLINGEHVAALVSLRGTNSGPLLSPDGSSLPPTNKKFGLLLAQAGETEPSGPLREDRLYMDFGTFLGQLGLHPGPHRPLLEAAPAKEVVIASGSEEEKANLAAVARSVELFNQHDVKGLLALMTDDVVFSDGAAPADFVGKKAVQKSYEDLFKGFHDVKLSVDESWAAGKYVVSEGSLSGTNDGNMASMKLKKTGKHVNLRFLEVDELAAGKLRSMRVFDNGMAFALQLGLLPPPGAGEKPEKPAAKPKS
jgi:ketosteroid isomerase-like protein